MQNPDQMTWNEVSELLNSELGENNTSNKYRKEFTRKFKDVVMNRENEVSAEEELYSKVSEKLVQIRKEKTILQDLRNDANAQLRAFDRLEYMAQIAENCAKEISSNLDNYKFNPILIQDKNKSKEGILALADWHFGLEIDSFWNVYNPTVCKVRLQSLLEDVIPYFKEKGIQRIHIFNLGDLISGRIHAQLRMQSRMNAVEQTLKVAELLHMFMLELRKNGFILDYYDCLDNHSRVEPDKKESMQLESFVQVIHWHIGWMFKNIPDVTIHENEYGPDFIVAKILDHTIMGVHGDKDTPNNAVKNLSALFGVKPDLILTAHKHHFSADETTRCPVLGCPSLMGADQYALDGRLDSSPAQLAVVVTSDDPMYDIHRIVVG